MNAQVHAHAGGIFLRDLIMLISIFTILSSAQFIQAQNIGIGTDSPDQKLDVNGNIKLGDHIMVEGNDTMKIYRNLTSYYAFTNAPGAYVIHTNQPVYNTQWAMTIEGSIFNSFRIFKIFLSGFQTASTSSGCIYQGKDKLPVQMGNDNGNLVFILGSTTGEYNYIQIAVTEFQVCFGSLVESNADGWSITRETDISAYSPVAIPDKTYLQWQEDGGDIYRLNGHTGIGTSSPDYPLDVSFDSDALSARGVYVINNNTSSFGQAISAIMGEIKSACTLNTRGAVFGYHNNTTGNSSGVYGETNSSSGYGVTGHNWGGGTIGRLATGNYGAYGSWGSSPLNFGYLAGESHGAYGKHGASENYGYLGGLSYGVYGRDGGNSTFGFLGGTDHGVQGYHVSTDNYGALGLASGGIYGRLGNTAAADGQYAITGYGIHTSSTPAGTGYTSSTSNGAVKGYNTWGNPYTFAVAGFTYLDYNRTGSCFGGLVDASTAWGCLCYQSSGGTEYGGYFTSYTSGAGDLPQRRSASINIGIAAYGDLFGAEIHGNIYGLYTEGRNYGLFSNGNVFRNKLDVHLQESGDQSNAILFTNVSTDVTIQTSGYGQLNAGRCMITFDDNFRKVASREFPVVVSVTPVGDCQGVYLEQVGADGFAVAERNAGRSNVEFSYIAIARRKGYEHPQLPREVTDPDYIQKLARGLHNDSDTQTDGEGLYFENGELYLGRQASAVPVTTARREE